MYYELWDVEVGNGTAQYSDDSKMATLVRTLVDAYAEELDLAIKEEHGTVHENLSGPRLIEWAGVILRRDQISLA